MNNQFARRVLLTSLAAMLALGLTLMLAPLDEAYEVGRGLEALPFARVPAAYAVCPLTVTVTNTNDSGAGSLRQAIADVCAGGTVNFGVAGTITLTGGRLVINKSLTINGPGAPSLAVSGNNTTGVFDINSGNNVTIFGLTIRDGNVPFADGGGIYNGGNLTLTDSVVISNAAGTAGGGISSGSGAMLTLTNVKISNNIALNQEGGGIRNDGTAVLNNVVLENNQASTLGGGFADFGTVTFISVTVRNNRANEGGGIWNNSLAPISMTNSSVISNTANGIKSNGPLTISNSAILSNTSNFGGGIYVDSTVTATLTNVTLSHNTAGTGGAIYVFSPVVMNNVTIAFNTGITNTGGIYGSPTLLANSIIAYNAGGNCGIGLPGSTYSLDSEDSCGFTLSGNITNTNPLLAPLANYGGPTLTHGLYVGSPAINAGNPVAPGSSLSACAVTDQRGVSRPVGPRCDIGAFEGTLYPLYLPLIEK